MTPKSIRKRYAMTAHRGILYSESVFVDGLSSFYFSGFYFRKGVEKQRWLIYLEGSQKNLQIFSLSLIIYVSLSHTTGGDWCYDASSCASRYASSPTLMSSAQWGTSLQAGGKKIMKIGNYF